MAGLRELRGRISSVGNIKQITRAMEMVATTKLRRFQDRALASRPYAREIAGLVGRLAAVLGEEIQDLPLFQPGQGEATGLLLVSSDRGLCGAYNSNLLRFYERWRQERVERGDERPVRLFVIGRKAFQYLDKRGVEIERFLAEPPLEHMTYLYAARIARILMESFLEAGCRDVEILYTAFESMARYVPTRLEVLPVGARLAGGEAAEEAGGDVILEPDARTIFESLVPRYVETTVYNALLEALTSEYASRRFSMKNATEAANEMQGVLKGQFNRLRQESITTELLDIVGGAEALR